MAYEARRSALGPLSSRPLPPEERDKCINETFDLMLGEAQAEWERTFASKHAANKAPKRRKVSEMTDEEWVASLEADPLFKGIDIRREIARCQFWCRQNKAVASRRRILNWLGKAEREFSMKAQGATHINGTLKLPAPDGPPGWHDWLAMKMPPDDHPAHGQLLAAYNCRNFSTLPASWQARCRAECAPAQQERTA